MKKVLKCFKVIFVLLLFLMFALGIVHFFNKPNFAIKS